MNFEILTEDVHTERYREIMRSKDTASSSSGRGLHARGLSEDDTSSAASALRSASSIFGGFGRAAALLLVALGALLLTRASVSLADSSGGRDFTEIALIPRSAADCGVFFAAGLAAAAIGAFVALRLDGEATVKDPASSSGNGSFNVSREPRHSDSSSSVSHGARSLQTRSVGRASEQPTGYFSGCLAGFSKCSMPLRTMRARGCLK